MTNITAPKIPDGEKVDFDVSHFIACFLLRNDNHLAQTWHISNDFWPLFGGRTSTGSVRRRTCLSCSLSLKPTLSRGRKRKRSSLLLWTELWVRLWKWSHSVSQCSTLSVSLTGEAACWASRATQDPSREREGAAGQTCGRRPSARRLIACPQSTVPLYVCYMI